MKRKQRKAKPRRLPAPKVAYMVKEWNPDAGGAIIGYTSDVRIAATYIGQRSLTGGRYFVNLVAQIGNCPRLVRYRP